MSDEMFTPEVEAELDREDKLDRETKDVLDLTRLKIDLNKATAPRKNEIGARREMPAGWLDHKRKGYALRRKLIHDRLKAEKMERLFTVVAIVLVALGAAAIKWAGVSL